MFGMEGVVKPIVEEMGLYKGAEIPAKAVYDRYFAGMGGHGIRPFGKFVAIAQTQLNLRAVVKEKDGEPECFFKLDRIAEMSTYVPRCNPGHPFQGKSARLDGRQLAKMPQAREDIQGLHRWQ
jgi:hypothetical protein